MTAPAAPNDAAGAREGTPAAALEALLAGNRRFVDGRPAHRAQDAARRSQLAAGQRPFAAVFGCSDSRVAAEIVFDQGLGALFVVRTAGHVVDTSVLGTLEFALEALDVPLVVVLGHDSCGAVRAAVDAVGSGQLPTGFLRDLVERVVPSVLAVGGDRTHPDVDAVEAEHVRMTVERLVERSRVLAGATTSGRLVVVGLVYGLADGRVREVARVS